MSKRAKKLGAGMKGKGQHAKTNYCAWQMRYMNSSQKEWTDGNNLR